MARVQPQRRFDLLLDAAERAARDCPRFRLVVIGRGSKLEATAREPARKRGLLDRVVFFPGYFEGADYVDVLRSLDVKLFLVPGTDGTARAVREALACGLPVLTTRRGMLPELVRDGVSGRVLDETPEAFARRWSPSRASPRRGGAWARPRARTPRRASRSRARSGRWRQLPGAARGGRVSAPGEQPTLPLGRDADDDPRAGQRAARAHRHRARA